MQIDTIVALKYKNATELDGLEDFCPPIFINWQKLQLKLQPPSVCCHGNTCFRCTDRRPWPHLNPGNTAAWISSAPWPRAFESLASWDKAVSQFTCCSADGEINEDETSDWTDSDTHQSHSFFLLNKGAGGSAELGMFYLIISYKSEPCTVKSGG